MVIQTNKPGALTVWYREISEFKSGPPPHRPLPHLTVGSLIVIILVGSFFVVDIADAIAIIVAYSPHAFFAEGLRITKWKSGLLSNGAYLSFLAKLIQVPATLLLMALLVCGMDLLAMLIRPVVARTPRLGMLLRLLGGAGLLLFAGNLYRQGYPFISPMAVAAIVGGAVLIWRAMASAIRGRPQEPQA